MLLAERGQRHEETLRRRRRMLITAAVARSKNSAMCSAANCFAYLTETWSGSRTLVSSLLIPFFFLVLCCVRCARPPFISRVRFCPCSSYRMYPLLLLFSPSSLYAMSLVSFLSLFHPIVRHVLEIAGKDRTYTQTVAACYVSVLLTEMHSGGFFDPFSPSLTASIALLPSPAFLLLLTLLLLCYVFDRLSHTSALLLLPVRVAASDCLRRLSLHPPLFAPTFLCSLPAFCTNSLHPVHDEGVARRHSRLLSRLPVARPYAVQIVFILIFFALPALLFLLTPDAD